MVGWYAPLIMGNIKKPGLHFHFVTDDHSKGGHVLNFKCIEGILTSKVYKKFEIELPYKA
jgi:acetolactate decarboxylase